ncbi:MAG: hypothetical protein LIP02_00310 [Bacteroidales bacterium]|nr:hypothetical protein [Bacteroidales bacterium]
MSNFLHRLRKLFGQPEPQSPDNNNPKIRIMAKKTVITKVLDANAQDGIIEFPQNRTLYADQFTDNAPNTDEEREGFRPKNMKDVFEHYQPSKEGVALETEDGGSVYEDFEFRQIKDFDDDQLIAQSPMMSEKKANIDAYNSIIRQLEKNKPLRNALKDPDSRESLKNVLKSLLAEINEAE